MQLGFVSAILPDLSLEEVVRFAAAEGFSCLELMCWPKGKAERRYAGVTHVDVIGMTKGRGFQGVVKRHRMAGGPAAHGSMFHRRGGSIGCREWPARIFKNKRMPGHMGNRNITTQNINPCPNMTLMIELI